MELHNYNERFNSRNSAKLLNEMNFSLFTSHFSRKRAAFTKPSRGTNGVRGELQSTETLSFRCCSERYRLMRGAAFTLAEVLITLGIIGVVAAITLPTLISNYRTMRDVTFAKKKFAEVQQLVSSIQAELGDYSNWSGMNTNTFFEQNVDKHINYVKKKKFGVTGENLIYKEAEINHQYNYIYEMADGTILIFGIPSAGINTHEKDKDKVWKIHVDINGLKEPNALGRDVFTMTLNTSQISTSPYYEYGFHAYGSGLDDEEIKERCIENYQSNYYKMNVDYGNHLWVMSIFANQNNNAHGKCTCLEYLLRNSWDYKKFPPKNK